MLGVDTRAQRQVLRLEVPLAQALRTTSTVFSSDNGFSTKSNAPILMARTADSTLPCPEMMTTWAST